MEALPPYALTEPIFPLRALAVATSRAPLGGVRESLMATLVAARHWMGALTLGATLRAALGQLLDATVRDDAPAVAAALANVTEVTAPHLDRKARSELDRLTRSIGA